jgi:iron(III) transport system substrate-binding protein
MTDLSLSRRGFLIAMGALGLAACSSAGNGASSGNGGSNVTSAADLDALVESARQEHTLTLYNSLADQDVEKWTEPFTEKYGIEIEKLRLPGAGPVVARWTQESNAQQYVADALLIADPVAVRQVNDDGLMAEYMPSSDSAFAAEFKVPGRSYPIVFAAEPMTWNVNSVSPEEQQILETQGVAALADPRWKGRLSVLIPVGIPINRAEWTRIVDKYGWEFVEKIAANEPTIYDSAVPLNDRLVAGEQSVAVFDSTAYSGNAIRSGAPLQFKWDGDAAITGFMTAIAKDAPHPNAARLFVEWATTAAAVAGLTNTVQALPGRSDVPGPDFVSKQPWYQPLAPEGYLSDWFTSAEFAKNDEQFNDKWSQIFGYAG